MSARDRIKPDARPRLRPEAVLLSRGDAEFQVGVDSATAVLIRDRGKRLQTVLRALDGSRTWSTVLAQVGADEIEPAELWSALHTLVAAGLAELDWQSNRKPLEGQVRLIGADVLGSAVGELLLRSRIELCVVDGSPAYSGLTRAESFRLRCQELGVVDGIRGDPIRVSSHWTKPETTEVQLTVIAASGLEADRVAPTELLRRDAPHLIVRPAVGGAVIGPLVVPGESSCLRCADLTRRDADPAWPGLLAQLGRRTAWLSPAVLAWAASTAVAQVMSFLGGGRPETVGATLELAAPTYAMRWRRWPPHPECGCHWNSPGLPAWP